MKTNRFLPSNQSVMTCLLTLGIFFATAAHAQIACKPLYDANDKMLSTPHHAYTTMTLPGGKPRSSEGITAGGVSYIQVRGAWKKSPLTVDDTRKQADENRKNAKNVSCNLLREDILDGQAVHVFHIHSENEDTKSDGTIWISASAGLPVKIEQDLDTGDVTGKSHLSTRYDYKNVTAPAVQ